jgi:hypothetical protein
LGVGLTKDQLKETVRETLHAFALANAFRGWLF